MIEFSVAAHAVGDPPLWPDADVDRLVHLPGPPTSLAVVEAGMGSGRSSVALRVALPDGTPLIIEWSLALFVAAARTAAAMAERWGERQ